MIRRGGDDLRERILKWIAKRIRLEDLVFLIFAFMIQQDCPRLEIKYGGRRRIVGLITQTPYAGDDET